MKISIVLGRACRCHGQGVGETRFPHVPTAGGSGWRPRRQGYGNPVSPYFHISHPCGYAAQQQDEHGFFLGGLRPPKPSRARAMFTSDSGTPCAFVYSFPIRWPIFPLRPRKPIPEQVKPVEGLRPPKPSPLAGCFLGGLRLPKPSRWGGLAAPTGRGAVRQAHRRWGNPVAPYFHIRFDNPVRSDGPSHAILRRTAIRVARGTQPGGRPDEVHIASAWAPR